jgi:two-component system nitrogen regulation sensor histidine kinase GlnL
LRPACGACTQDPVPVHVNVAASERMGEMLVELWPLEQQARQDREERLREQAQANKELIRNLAHEIKNPLGGIRGAAQLLEMELESRDLKEYTQVIIHEADRLQSLVDRLLAPHRHPASGGRCEHPRGVRTRALAGAGGVPPGAQGAARLRHLHP